MASQVDEDEDFVYYGTPLAAQQEAGGKFRGAKEAGPTRAQPLHKQEATDEQGRKRFHGAFTGGFSAGYFNTVGSKVGCRCPPSLPRAPLTPL